MTDDEILDQAVEAANEIGTILEGKSSVAALIALSMVLGESEARAPRPDFHRMIHLVSAQAFDAFNRRLQAND